MIVLVKKEQYDPRKISDTYTVYNMLTKKMSQEVSAAIGVAKNHSEITKNTKSNRVYFVLEGQLKIKEGGKTYLADPGDLVYIPANTQYEFGGSFKVVLINAPAFSPENEETKE